MMYHGRMKTGNIMVGKTNWDPEKSNAIIRLILYLYIIGQSIIIYLYVATDKIEVTFIMVCDIIVNASVPLIVLITGAYLNVKFSGSPFLSGEYEKKNCNRSNYNRQDPIPTATVGSLADSSACSECVGDCFQRILFTYRRTKSSLSSMALGMHLSLFKYS